MTASGTDEAVRSKVLAILSDRLLPGRMRRISDAMVAGHVADVLPEMMPADTFYLAAEFQRKYPDQPATIGSAILELQELCQQHPEQTNWQRAVSRLRHPASEHGGKLWFGVAQRARPCRHLPEILAASG